VSRPPGPVEKNPWPEELRCYVVTPGSDPRLHGYAVEGDLAPHYRLSEVTLLALSGELPSDPQREAFEVAFIFLSALSAAEAPVHAALLAQICGSRSSAVIAVAAVALSERARTIVAESRALVEWLASPEKSLLDAAFTTNSDEERAAVERLRHALERRGVAIDALTRPLSRMAAILATLHFAGLTRTDQLEAALVLASLPTAVAEARMHGVASFRDYPMLLPPFEYEDP
jgi:hypothetical protein